MSDIRRAIEAAMRDELGIEPPSPDTDLIASGLFDSLAVVSILAVLEQRLGVRVALDALTLDDLRTIRRLELLFVKASSVAA